DGAEGRAPADDCQLGAFAAYANILVRDVVGDPKHFGEPRVGHLLVRGGRIIDVAGAGRLLDPADAVLETRRPRLDPGPREVVVARIRHDGLPFGWRRLEIADRKRLEAAHV